MSTIYWSIGIPFWNLPLQSSIYRNCSFVILFWNQESVHTCTVPLNLLFCLWTREAFIWTSKVVLALNFNKNLICKILTVFCVVHVSLTNPTTTKPQTTTMAVYFFNYRGKDLNGRWLFRMRKPIRDTYFSDHHKSNLFHSSSGPLTMTPEIAVFFYWLGRVAGVLTVNNCQNSHSAHIYPVSPESNPGLIHMVGESY